MVGTWLFEQTTLFSECASTLSLGGFLGGGGGGGEEGEEERREEKGGGGRGGGGGAGRQELHFCLAFAGSQRPGSPTGSGT